jgi:hypothetical protein
VPMKSTNPQLHLSLPLVLKEEKFRWHQAVSRTQHPQSPTHLLVELMVCSCVRTRALTLHRHPEAQKVMFSRHHSEGKVIPLWTGRTYFHLLDPNSITLSTVKFSW